MGFFVAERHGDGFPGAGRGLSEQVLEPSRIDAAAQTDESVRAHDDG